MDCTLISFLLNFKGAVHLLRYLKHFENNPIFAIETF